MKRRFLFCVSEWMNNDRRAVEGLPLKLMIVATLISISFPFLFNALENFQQNIELQKIKEIADRIRSEAISCYIAGPGNIRNIEITSDTSNLFLDIGGNFNSTECRSIRCFIDSTLACTIFLEKLPVRLSSNGEDSLFIQVTDCILFFECISDEHGTWVKVGIL